MMEKKEFCDLKAELLFEQIFIKISLKVYQIIICFVSNHVNMKLTESVYIGGYVIYEQ